MEECVKLVLVQALARIRNQVEVYCMMLPHAACIKLWNNNPLEPAIVVIYKMFLVGSVKEFLIKHL